MSVSIGGRLRRLAEAVQRSLFDTGDDAPEPPPALAHAQANRSFVHEGNGIAYLLRRSRRRSIGFAVGVEGLVVTAPRWVALRAIDSAVREKGGWIVARLVEQRERAARIEAARIVWADGASLRLLGEPVTLVLDPGLAGDSAAALDGATQHHAGGAPVDKADDEVGDRTGEAGGAEAAAVPGGRRLRVRLPVDAAPERIQDAVQSWLKREAERVFALRSQHFAQRLGVRVTRLRLSTARTRWGSASADGSIRLNWRLIHYPLSTIDYVVAHELAHLREMNHGPRFWSLVRSVAPHADAARRELRHDAAVHLE